jgi:Cu-processing system ATP-binding protein
MIKINNLSKNFGKLKVLDKVNLHFKEGECIALIGPNGCGKTTLIKSILGMVIPTSGEIIFKDKSIENSYAYREYIGYMPQIGRYPDNMTIGQVINMIKTIRKNKGQLDTELLTQFNLSAMYDKGMGTLSGGTMQKVSASIAFLFRPDVLILDEPTAGLDPLAAEVLKEKIIAEKKNGKLILITSHILSELDELITQLIFMQDGCIHFHKNTDVLKQETGQATISKAISSILKSQAK